MSLLIIFTYFLSNSNRKLDPLDLFYIPRKILTIIYDTTSFGSCALDYLGVNSAVKHRTCSSMQTQMYSVNEQMQYVMCVVGSLQIFASALSQMNGVSV